MWPGLGKGKRRQEEDRPSQGTAAIADTSKWLGKPDIAPAVVAKKPGKQQLKLVYPGEVGSGIATLRQKKAHPDSSFSGTASSSSKASSSKRKSAPSTLDAFFGKKAASAQRKSRSKSVTTTNDSKRQKGDKKGKQRAVEAEEDSDATEPEPDDNMNRLPSLEPDLRSERSDKPIPVSPALVQQQPSASSRHPPDETNLVLPPMPKPLPAPKPPNLGLFGFGALPRPPSPSSPPKAKKQKMVVESSSPIKASVRNEKVLAPPSTPSFFATAPSQASSSPFSPVRPSPQKQSPVLRSDGIAASATQDKPDRKQRRGSRIAWDSQDSVELRRLNRSPSSIAIQESLVPKRPPRCPPSVHLSQDVTDYMDAFRDEEYSEEVQYTLEASMQRVRREKLGLSPIDVRKVRAEKDKLWREEMEAVRIRKRQREEERMAQVEHEMAMQAAALAAGRKERDQVNSMGVQLDLESEFDESATEKTLPSQDSAVQRRNFKPNQQVDDSGFEDAIMPGPSSTSEETSQKSIYTLAPNSQPDFESLNVTSETVPSSQQNERREDFEESALEESLIPLPAATAARLRSGFSAILPANLLEYPETLAEEQDDRVETVPDSEGEEEDMSLDMLSDRGEDTQEAVASMLLQPLPTRARSRILAPDTQDVSYIDTQGINVEETMLDAPLPRKHLANLQELDEEEESSRLFGDHYEISVPCSQGEEEEELDPLFDEHAKKQDEALANQPSPFTDAISTANLIITRKAQNPSKAKSVEESIRLAGFGDVLESSLQGRALAQQKPAQTDLFQFFPVKEGGPAAREAQAAIECQHAFVQAVGELSRSYARKEFVEEQQEESLLDDETIPDSQIVPSSQTQEDASELESLPTLVGDNYTLPPDLGSETDITMDIDVVEDSEDEEGSSDFEVKGLSCEAWVEGLSSQVPSPVKRLRGA